VVNGKYGGAEVFSGKFQVAGTTMEVEGWEVMSLPRLVYRILMSGLALGWVAALSAALPERKTFQFGEFMIEASAGDEAYVEALAKQLADFQLPTAVSTPTPRSALGDLEKRKDYFLAKVSTQIGLAEPTERMKSVFEGTQKGFGLIGHLIPPGLPQHFALWRKPELLTRIEAGESIPGFSNDAAGQLRFNFNMSFENKPELTNEQNQSGLADEWRKIVLPVKIAATPDRTPEQDAAAGLDHFLEFRQGWLKASSIQTQRAIAFLTLREATEAGIVWHYLASKDRRWFCDGIANYVAWKVIEAELGPEEARGYYDLSAELKKYANEASKIDLAAWPAAENLKQANYAENINTANYAFATKVIADVCAKHGDSILPKLFAEIGKTPYEKATLETVYRAFKKLTREDMRSYLPKPAAKR